MKTYPFYPNLFVSILMSSGLYHTVLSPAEHLMRESTYLPAGTAKMPEPHSFPLLSYKVD